MQQSVLHSPEIFPCGCLKFSCRAAPASSAQACSALGVQRIGDDSLIAHCPRRPCRSSVKETASVFGSVGAKAINLQRFPIVQIPADRTPYDGDACQPSVCLAADGKLVSNDGLMMSVTKGDKGICFGQRNGGKRQQISASLSLIALAGVRSADVRSFSSTDGRHSVLLIA